DALAYRIFHRCAGGEAHVTGWRSAPRRARQLLAEEGGRALLLAVLGETVYRRLLLLERELGEPAAAPEPQIPATFGLLADHELGDYVALDPGADLEELARRLRAGQLCVVGRVNGRIRSE